MTGRKEDQVQRDHFFCIIDEVDSILVDEARTPLVISGPMQEDKPLPAGEIKPITKKLVSQQQTYYSWPRAQKISSMMRTVMRRPKMRP